MKNYLLKIVTTSPRTTIHNFINQLEGAEKQWKLNQYYYQEVWSEAKQNKYKETKSKWKLIKAAYTQNAHANKQAIICLSIQKKVMQRMLKIKMIKEELTFKQAWVNQLIDAVTMEIAESWLKLYQLKTDDDKENGTIMTKIHDYEQKYWK